MAHGVAAALGVHARVPHGLACAVMLPAALAANRAVCEPLLARLARHVWDEFWPSDAAAADALVERIDQLCQAVGVPSRLRELGVRREQIPAHCARFARQQHGRQSAHAGRRRTRAAAGGPLVIVAAGLSPAWQQILVFDGFSLGEVNRAREAVWCASGKVLNVGLSLAHLRATCVTMAPLGGLPRAAIEREFAGLNAPARWIDCESPTRTCTTLLDAAAGRRRRNWSRTPAPCRPRSWRRSAPPMSKRRRGPNWLCSAVRCRRERPRRFIAICSANTPCPAILDVRGPELLAALACRPLIVKPNRAELASTFDRDLSDDAALLVGHAGVELGRGAVDADHAGQACRMADVARGGISSAAAEGRQHRESHRLRRRADRGHGLGIGAWRGPLLAARTGMAAAAERLGQLLPGRLDPQRVLARVDDVVVERA